VVRQKNKNCGIYLLTGCCCRLQTEAEVMTETV